MVTLEKYQTLSQQGNDAREGNQSYLLASQTPNPLAYIGGLIHLPIPLLPPPQVLVKRPIAYVCCSLRARRPDDGDDL